MVGFQFTGDEFPFLNKKPNLYYSYITNSMRIIGCDNLDYVFF